MVANHHYTRLDTLELKDLIYRKIGHQRAEKYFNQLKGFFSLQVKKVDFDKSCIQMIGRDNIYLHNQFIRAIIKNACLAKVLPPKARKVDGSLSVKVTNGYQRSCFQSLYGDAFSPSPRKSRSPVNRERKFRDRPSPLGLLGKSPSLTGEEVVPRVQEQQSATELHSLGSRPPLEVASVEDGEEVEQAALSPSIQSRSPVTAPLGISMKAGGARKAFRSGYGCAYNFHPQTCQSSSELPDTRSLISRLEQKIEFDGLGISIDCVNLLNNGIDVYLKRLIEPCMQIAGSRHGQKHDRHVNGQLNPDRNGILPGKCTQRQEQSLTASMLDFRVAMEGNPHILGEEWAIQLEKICTRASGE